MPQTIRKNVAEKSGQLACPTVRYKDRSNALSRANIPTLSYCENFASRGRFNELKSMFNPFFLSILPRESDKNSYRCYFEASVENQQLELMKSMIRHGVSADTVNFIVFLVLLSGTRQFSLLTVRVQKLHVQYFFWEDCPYLSCVSVTVP